MNKKKLMKARRFQIKKNATKVNEALPIACFSFGDAERVLQSTNRFLNDATVNLYNDELGFFEPPYPLLDLAKLRHANPHHGSAISFKRNQLCKYFVPSDAVALVDFRAAALDFFISGNAYFQVIKNNIGAVLRLKHVPMLNIRRDRNTKDNQRKYKQVINKNGEIKIIKFKIDEILHVKEYDSEQQIYGTPDWLCAMQSILLNEDATLFRRRYYANGCHVGYILYTSDPTVTKEMEEQIKQEFQNGKGVGNFKSLYMHIPNGKEKSIQIIPVGDISQRDEFEKIKKITADDIIVAHRIPPALAGLMPQNAAGFGSVEKIAAVYLENEVQPMAQPFLELNNLLTGNNLFTFNF